MQNGRQRITSVVNSTRNGTGHPCLRFGHRGRYWCPARATISARQIRGAKTHANSQVESVSKASQPAADALGKSKNGPIYPTVVQQALDNMHKYGDCVLLTRVGSFYELYFHQAQKYGPLLNLKVAAKITAVGDVPMSGFPFYQLDRFLKILVQDLGEHVAISDEFANDAVGKVKSGGLMFDRRVARVVTPGTLIDEKFLDGMENNFLLAIDTGEEGGVEDGIQHRLQGEMGLAWLDLSTGDFFTQAINAGRLSTIAARIGAKEVVMSSSIPNPDTLIRSLLNEVQFSITKHQVDLAGASMESWKPLLDGVITAEVQENFTHSEIRAGQLLLSYVQDRLHGSNIKLQVPIRKVEKESMGIDANSMRALEILTTSKEGYGKGSLLHSIRRTVTRSGSRLLREWISSPSMSLQTINSRLDLVSILLANPPLIEQITALLKRSYDSQRLVQKFSLGRGDADDLISVSRTVDVTRQIGELLDQKAVDLESDVKNSHHESQTRTLENLRRRLCLDGPLALIEIIESSIDEEGLMESHRVDQEDGVAMIQMAKDILETSGTDDDRSAMKGIAKSKAKARTPSEHDGEDQKPWIVCRTASYVLDNLHQLLDELRVEKAALADDLRAEHNAQSLTLRWTPGLGHICHIKGRLDPKHTSSDSRLLKATKSTSSVHDPAWSKLGSRIDQARLRIRAEERNVLQDLRSQVVKNLIPLRRNAAILDELDIGCSFASLAQEQSLVRPTINSGDEHHVVRGRHPTVKQGLEEDGRAFVSNDCHLGEKERIWLITGPNMAGKSTFLRQKALIAILAQAGSFVPAESADLGLIDQMFTRVGSADNLFRDQSTFMVEMLETATILKQATPRSFVIMDEIGRGTTPEDGIAIGYACLDHLYHRNQCRTIFATHFHGLTDMTKHLEHIACYCTDVAEGVDGTFSFVHRLRPGVNRTSHALKVATLAGLPQSVIDTARFVLEEMGHGPVKEPAARSPKLATAG